MKKILIVNESLALAGGEKSLITLLSKIDPEKYEIDLQLIRYGGELDAFIPKHVNVLPELSYPEFSRKSWLSNFSNFFSKNGWKFLKSKFKFSLALRKGKFSHPEIAQLYWENVKECYNISEKKYDIAIAYAQGVPTFYVMDKVNASKKIAWVNVNVKMTLKNKEYQENYYKKYNDIIAVSEGTYEHMSSLFPQFKDKLIVIKDMIDYSLIIKMSEKSLKNWDKDCLNILTVARLNKYQKGYDITLETCKILKEKKIQFHWYAIGDGPYKDEMQKYILEHDLGQYFTFLGTTSNPYPYFKAADLYVQTSRHEGYGLSIAEARLLNIPVVTTNFDTVHMQMIHEKNGLISDMNAQSVAENIMRLQNDKRLYQSIVEYLKKEPKENLEPLVQFYQLVDNN